MNEVQQREKINGKPHFGIYFYRSIIFNEERMTREEATAILEKNMQFQELQIRNKELIYRPTYVECLLHQNAAMAIKFILWGRAYKIMKLLRKNKKKYVKKYISGRRKLVRSK